VYLGRRDERVERGELRVPAGGSASGGIVRSANGVDELPSENGSPSMFHITEDLQEEAWIGALFFRALAQGRDRSPEVECQGNTGSAFGHVPTSNGTSTISTFDL
jgi:hypothetical protein